MARVSPRAPTRSVAPLVVAVALAPLLLAAVACAPPKPSDIPGPETKWKKMSHADRSIYMTTTVLPRMQETFAAFDPERYASVDCRTCHVTGAERGDYAMPDPGIPPLSRWKFKKEHWDKHPETVQFMWEKVKPEMSALLGGKRGLAGFNCGSCHTTR